MNAKKCILLNPKSPCLNDIMHGRAGPEGGQWVRTPLDFQMYGFCNGKTLSDTSWYGFCNDKTMLDPAPSLRNISGSLMICMFKKQIYMYILTKIIMFEIIFLVLLIHF